jgi:hypothetical protein
MGLTIEQAFELPQAAQITAMEFVVRLEDQRDEARDERLVRDYVLTPKVREALPVIFNKMLHFSERGEDQGRFIHGSFGSGKSHFLSLLGLLFEGHEGAWARALSEGGLEEKHKRWAQGSAPLVVRLHMLTEDRSGWGLDRIVYECVNRTLERKGHAPFRFLDLDGVLSEIRNTANLVGPSFWAKMEEKGILGSQEEFEELASGTEREREGVVRAYLELVRRDATSAGVNPNWAEGLRRLAKHVKEQGYGALVLLVDELLLWLKTKTPPEFRGAINQLNLMVDRSTGKLDIPLFPIIARQRNLEEFFPNMQGETEKEMHEYLSHHSKRFEQTTLEDVELRYVVKGRLLRPRAEAKKELLDKINAICTNKEYQALIQEVLQGSKIDYVQDVYPFHPALIEALIDISSLMQRERTALRLLTEMLVVHHPTLEVGKFLPVGRAFEAIIPAGGVEADKRQADIKAIHNLYYNRLRLGIKNLEESAEKEGKPWSQARRDALDQVVKTVLLMELSPRLKNNQSATVERLVRLNDKEVAGTMDRARFAQVREDLVALSRLVTEIQVAGSSGAAVVSVTLKGVNTGEWMELARGKAGESKPARFKVFKALLLGALGLSDNETLVVKWRETPRRGHVQVCNVRELRVSSFNVEPGEEFRLFIDYPWDDPAYGVEQDIQHANEARRNLGKRPTICWLPRHFNASEMGYLVDLVAIDYLLGSEGQGEIQSRLTQTEQSQMRDWLATQRKTIEEIVRPSLLKVYGHEGQVVVFNDSYKKPMPTGDLKEFPTQLVRQLFDVVYPKHPTFKSEPQEASLRALADFFVRAKANANRAEFDVGTELKALQMLGEPLQLLEVGQSAAAIRQDGEYLQAIQRETSAQELVWDQTDARLAKDYGFQPLVRNFFLYLLVKAFEFRALEQGTGAPQEIKVQTKLWERVQLNRAPVLDHHEWTRARSLAEQLLGEVEKATRPSVSDQDRFLDSLRKRAGELTQQLNALSSALLHHKAGGGERHAEIQEAVKRLSPLLSPLLERDRDTSKPLRAWLEMWPKEIQDGTEHVVKQARVQHEALLKLDKTSHDVLSSLANNANHHEHSRALGLLAEFRDHLRTAESKAALSEAWVLGWNNRAKDCITSQPPQTTTTSDVRVQESKPTTQAEGSPPQESAAPEPTTPKAPQTLSDLFPKQAVLLRDHRLTVGDEQALEGLLRELRECFGRAELEALKGKQISINILFGRLD